MPKHQSACGLLDHYYQALIHCLPMKDDMFLSELRHNGLLPEDVNTTLESLASPAEKASYFLDTILKPNISSDGDICLHKLLFLMKSSVLENVAELAKKIMTELNDVIKSYSGLKFPEMNVGDNSGPAGVEVEKLSVCAEAKQTSAVSSSDYCEMLCLKDYKKIVTNDSCSRENNASVATCSAISDTNEHYSIERWGTLATRNPIIELQAVFTKMQNVVGVMPDMQSVFYEIFCRNFMRSSYPIPLYVLEFLNKKNCNELLNFVTNETPCFNHFSIALMEQIVEVIDDKDAEKMLTYYKEVLFTAKRDHIMPLMIEYQVQKENFVKVVFQMKKCFDFFTYEGFYVKVMFMSLILLKLNLVDFGGYDKRRITCYIPSICAERAIANVNRSVDLFEYFGIVSVTIDRHIIVKSDERQLDYYVMQHDTSAKILDVKRNDEETGNAEETENAGETNVKSNFDYNGAQQQQVTVNKDLTDGEAKHQNISIVTDNASKPVESENHTISPHPSSPVLTQQPCDLSNKSFANSTQQVTDKPQPIHSSQLNDIETDMQLETAHQTPDALSTKNHLSTKEEQKETNLTMSIRVNVHEVVFLNIDVKPLDLIEAVKCNIHMILSVPPIMQMLSYMDVVLENNVTVKFCQIKDNSMVLLKIKVEMLFHDVINLLPTNPWYAIEILKRSPNLSKLGDKFEKLSKTIDNHVVIYETLLPYVYKKCGYNVLQLIDTLERTLKTNDQRRKLKEFRNAIILSEDKGEQGAVYPNNDLSDEVTQHQHSGAEFSDTDLTHPVMKAEPKPVLANNLSESTELLLDHNHSVNDITSFHLPDPVPLTQQSLKLNFNSTVEDSTQIVQSRASKLSPLYNSQQLSSTKIDVKPVLENDQFSEPRATDPPSTMKHSEENQEIKIMDHSSHLSSTPDKEDKLPSNIITNKSFDEVKLHYNKILQLMPDDHLETVSKLQEYFSDDEIASVLEEKDSKVANKRILDSLIQRMKVREEMLDFCDQLEKISKSQELKAITSEIQKGVLQSIQHASDTVIRHPENTSESTLPSFKLSPLPPPPLPLNHVSRQGILDGLATQLRDAIGKTIIAVTGIGGLGKTTVVTALCHHPFIEKKFKYGVLFIELGPQATDPIIKLNEIYFELVGKHNKNINNVEAEIKEITKNNWQNLLVIIDDIWYREDAEPIVNAFDNCRMVLTTRRNDIAVSLKAQSIVKMDPMTLDEALALLTNKLFDLSKLSREELELLEKLANDAHRWPVLLSLIRGQLHHSLNLNTQDAIKKVQMKLQSKGLTAFDKNDIESVKRSRNKSVTICIETTLELLTESVLNKLITLVLFTGIGGHFIKDVLHVLWKVPNPEAREAITILSAYSLVSLKEPIMQHIKSQIVGTHSVICQYIVEHVIRSEQVANLSPFAMLNTYKAVWSELESLYKVSYGKQRASQLDPKEYLAYNMHKIEQVSIPFQLKRITAHLLHDPHVILLMLQRIQATIHASNNKMQILTRFGEQIVNINHNCKKALKDSRIIDRKINLKVQNFLYQKKYVELESILEEYCTTFSIGVIAQNCISVIEGIIPLCEDTLKESFGYVTEMLQKMTPQYHSIDKEQLPVMKLYINLHKDIAKALETGSREELNKIYIYIACGEFNLNLESLSFNTMTEFRERIPQVLSSSLAMYNK